VTTAASHKWASVASPAIPFNKSFTLRSLWRFRTEIIFTSYDKLKFATFGQPVSLAETKAHRAYGFHVAALLILDAKRLNIAGMP
jgi:hypothetical protein